jgi:hypothetical protein
MLCHFFSVISSYGFQRPLLITFGHCLYLVLELKHFLEMIRSFSCPTILITGYHFIYTIAEERLRSFPRVKCESSKQELQLRALQKELPTDSNVTVDRPLCGGSIWAGEQDAWEATKQLVEVEDRNGKLRGIIEAVRANRVEDDFSKIWSFAKEDFERKLYSKRSKVKISFVQLDDTIPVHGPDCELVEDLLWEDFITLLDRKERQVVVCLRNGVTKVDEISKILGYSNHSPVSKTLARIRQKAKQYFELD